MVKNHTLRNYIQELIYNPACIHTINKINTSVRKDFKFFQNEGSLYMCVYLSNHKITLKRFGKTMILSRLTHEITFHLIFTITCFNCLNQARTMHHNNLHRILKHVLIFTIKSNSLSD